MNGLFHDLSGMAGATIDAATMTWRTVVARS